MEAPTIAESAIYLALTTDVDISTMSDVYFEGEDQALWRQALERRKTPVDLSLLANERDKRLALLWIKCRQAGVHDPMWFQYCANLRTAYVQRSVQAVIEKCKFSDDEETSKIVQAWAKELERAQSKSIELPKPSVYIPTWITELENRNGKEPEMLTGFPKLDELFWGLHRGEVITIGARTSRGKSTFALNMAVNLVKRNKKVLFFSTEMSISEKWSRIISNVSGVDFSKFRKAELTVSDWTKIIQGAELMSGDYFFVCDAPSPTIEQIEAVCSRIRPDVLILDYLGMFTYPKADREDQAISEFMKRVKIISRQYEMATLVVSQLNRMVDHRPNQIPTMADLKSSGSIEQESDIVVLLYNDIDHDQVGATRRLILDVAKNRHGECVLVKLAFYLPTLKMMEVIE